MKLVLSLATCSGLDWQNVAAGVKSQPTCFPCVFAAKLSALGLFTA